MARSLKKGPYVDEKLLKKVEISSAFKKKDGKFDFEHLEIGTIKLISEDINRKFLRIKR